MYLFIYLFIYSLGFIKWNCRAEGVTGKDSKAIKVDEALRPRIPFHSTGIY